MTAIQQSALAMVEHIKSKRSVNFRDTMVPARITGYMEFLVKEAIEISLHFGNFNRDTGFSWSCS
jgi:hypothetical protein